MCTHILPYLRSFLPASRASKKYVSLIGDIETPAGIVKALSFEAATTAGTTIALVNTMETKQTAMKGKVVKHLGARTVHNYEYPRATSTNPVPAPIVRQHNGITGAGRQEIVSMTGKQNRLEPFLRETSWKGTLPKAVTAPAVAPKESKKDALKDEQAKKERRSKPKKEKVGLNKKKSSSEWRLSVAEI